jgi:uncharacterized membrane protein HdeD (DUF308 family)
MIPPWILIPLNIALVLRGVLLFQHAKTKGEWWMMIGAVLLVALGATAFTIGVLRVVLG